MNTITRYNKNGYDTKGFKIGDRVMRLGRGYSEKRVLIILEISPMGMLKLNTRGPGWAYPEDFERVLNA